MLKGHTKNRKQRTYRAVLIWLEIRQLALIIPWILMISGCYVVRQAIHQNDLFNSRLRVVDVVDDRTTPLQIRAKLTLIADVLMFAAKNGLNSGGAYEFFVDNQKRAVSFILQVAYQDRLKSLTWWFPVVGRVPYLGFFSRSERELAASEFVESGFDVDLGEASAFSMLGWFSDPVFSSMLNRPRAELVHLVLHELVHRTVWIVGSTQFNEQLAEYVAEILSAEFIKENLSQAEFTRYREKREDKIVFNHWLRNLKLSLEQLYKKRLELPLSDLLKKKQELVTAFQSPPNRPIFRQIDYVKSGEPWNNASILASTLYATDVAWFDSIRKCLDPKGTVGSFLDILTDRVNEFEQGVDPNLGLDGICSQAYSTQANL